MSRHARRPTPRHPLNTWVRTVGLAALAGPIVAVSQATWRDEVVLSPETDALLQAGQPVIYAVWHGRMYAILRAFRRLPQPTILVSPSNDGEFTTRMARRLGFQRFVRGSAKRGGHQATRGLLRELRHQHPILFTVDGPRGPHQVVKPGIIRLAAQAGVPIVPLISSSRYLMVENHCSWDHFHAPLWGTPMRIHLATPLWVPHSVDSHEAAEPYRNSLEQSMRTLTEALDRSWGVKGPWRPPCPPE